MKAIYCTNLGDSYHPISYHSIVDSYHSRVTLNTKYFSNDYLNMVSRLLVPYSSTECVKEQEKEGSKRTIDRVM